MDSNSFDDNYFIMVDKVNKALKHKPHNAVYAVINSNGVLYMTVTMPIREYHRLRLLWADCPDIVCDTEHTHASLHLKSKYSKGIDTEQLPYTFPNNGQWVDHIVDDADNERFEPFFKFVKQLIKHGIIDIRDLGIDHPYLTDGMVYSPI